jgi:hypothetical protein
MSGGAMEAEQYDDGIIYLKASTPKAKYIDAYKVPESDLYYLQLHADWDAFSKVPPKTQKDIEWVAYNFTGFHNPSVIYSFEMPWHGPYCEGCFDGWPYNNQSANVEGSWMTGGYFDQMAGRKWSLSTGILYKDAYIPNSSRDLELNTYLPAMFENMLATKVGGSVPITDRYNSDGKSIFTAMRRADIKPFGDTSFAMFTTTDPEAQQYALLNRGEYIIVFAYAHSEKVYDVFETIISSFKLSHNEEAVYGNLPPVENLDGYEQIEKPGL